MATVYWIETKRNPFSQFERNPYPEFIEQNAKDRICIVLWDSSGFSMEQRVVPEECDDARYREICDMVYNHRLARMRNR
jgi:hypothetical protein